ncbi:hypothetical protein [Streptomyces sp. RKAG293]|uniref:hypothetical protein n=1 Tax=Streptomyces sp. RKAG293 TaxID=2893403 RepID=UPI002034A6F8|nr:hypothetical protein [Streptomyces sp. RKAG293]MCM2423520.1 hypothetical protein [Streptomyces sp. RKAG293]
MTADQHPHTPGTTGSETDSFDEAHAVRSSVRRAARGMAHHEAEEELEKAQSEEDGGKQGGEQGEDGEDGPISPAVEEWERIVDLLTTHAGPYDPDSDPFVQGELTAHANRKAARRTEADGDASGGTDADGAGADDAGDTLLRALARTGVRDGAGSENESVVARIVQADPAAALAVSHWLDAAFAAGRARTED